MSVIHKHRLAQSCSGLYSRSCRARAHMRSIEYSREDTNACRRNVLLSGVVTVLGLQCNAAEAGFDKYIKKKALDPLVSYIPVLLIASEQLNYVQLAASDLGCDETRSLLRKGVFVGLRDNIRSVGEYSAEVSGKQVAQSRVKRVFASLEALDGALFLAAREKDSKVPEDLDKLIEEAQQSIAALLVDVPEGDMQKAREVVSVVNGADASVQSSPAPSAPNKAAAERLEALL